MMAVEFQGAKQLRDMAARLRRLSQEMQSIDEDAVAAELEALKPAVRRSAITTLPHRGGINRLVANSDLKIVRRGQAVSLRASNKANIRRMNDRGILRHPVFARPDRTRREWRWVDQRIPRHWFDNPTLSTEMRLRRAVDRARQRAIDRVR